MGIVAIVLVSLLMLVLGGELLEAKNGVQMTIALAIFSTSAVVAVASIANDNLQDLKTGWLVGATPWRQQVALLIGCVLGAAVISPVLELLYNAYGFADAMPREGMDPGQAPSAPQATLMLAIARGIFSHQLNWTMILIGMAVGVGLIAVDAIMQRTAAWRACRCWPWASASTCRPPSPRRWWRAPCWPGRWSARCAARRGRRPAL